MKHVTRFIECIPVVGVFAIAFGKEAPTTKPGLLLAWQFISSLVTICIIGSHVG